jgi:hypothetical protein
MSACVSIRQHTSAYVSIREKCRQQTTAYVSPNTSAYVNAYRPPATSAYVSIRQHTSAYVSIRERIPASRHARIRQHTSAYVRIRQHTSAYVSIRPHTSAYVNAYRPPATRAPHPVPSTLPPPALRQSSVRIRTFVRGKQVNREPLRVLRRGSRGAPVFVLWY